MNESFLRSSSRGDIEGIFRDSYGRVLIQFGKKVVVDSTVQAELLVLRESILVAAVSRLSSSHSIVFKLDFQLVVAWIVDPSLTM